jgi:SAM-dependent methyltransferase
MTMIPLQRRYWNGLSDEYQRITRITLDDFHYGPQIPGESRLRLLPPLRPGMRALELGCGAAQNSVWLARQGLDCTAVDISAEQLRHAEALARREGVAIKFVESPLETFESRVEGPFDLVHSSHALEFVDDPAAVLRCAFDLLVPGGVFVLSTVHPLYNGDWIGSVDDDGLVVENEDGAEERGLFLTNYFQPPDDVRHDERGRVVVVSLAYPVSAWFDWLREAGFEVVRLAEPPAVPRGETPPYTSDAWAEPDGELEAIPGTLILVGRRPR